MDLRASVFSSKARSRKILIGERNGKGKVIRNPCAGTGSPPKLNQFFRLVEPIFKKYRTKF